MRALFAAVLTLVLFAIPAAAERRLALVVGNASYAHATALANPLNDARRIASALERAGFEVMLGLDLTKSEFDRTARDFARKLSAADVALVFYAGHGLQVAGRNYLVPVDARLETERDLEFEAVRLDFLLAQMELDREGKTSLVFLDACRDNPLARNLARSMGTRSASLGKGLAQVQSGVGTFIAYATQPGNVALDGASANSPFSEALARHAAEPGRSLNAVMIEVRKDVIKATDGRQVPWDHSALTGEFFFMKASAPATIATMPPKPAQSADEIAALNARLKQLEAEIARRNAMPDPAQALALRQAETRLADLEREQQRLRRQVFDLQKNSMREKDQRARMDITRDLHAALREQGRVGREIAALRSEIERLGAATAADGAAGARGGSRPGVTVDLPGVGVRLGNGGRSRAAD
ncbi:MAG: caspase family protein [Hyphomicrobiaceae bacterium]